MLNKETQASKIMYPTFVNGLYWPRVTKKHSSWRSRFLCVTLGQKRPFYKSRINSYFFTVKLDFIYCSHCKNRKTKSGKTILENNNLKVTVLPKKRILFNFEYYLFLVWLWKSWDIEKAYELFYYIRCIRKVVYDRVLMIP